MAPEPACNPGQPAQTDPAAIVRLYCTGVAVSTSEQTFDVRYVVDGRDGTLVFPASRDFLRCESPVLSVPDHRADALFMLLALEEIADWRSDEACDRWLAMGKHTRNPLCLAASISLARATRYSSGDLPGPPSTT